MEDNVRMTLTNKDTRDTFKTGFINNTKSNKYTPGEIQCLKKF